MNALAYVALVSARGHGKHQSEVHISGGADGFSPRDAAAKVAAKHGRVRGPAALAACVLAAGCGKPSPAKLDLFSVEVTHELESVRVMTHVEDKDDARLAVDGTLQVVIARNDKGSAAPFDSQTVACRGSIDVTKAQFSGGSLTIDVPMQHCPTYDMQTQLVAVRFTASGGGAALEAVESPDDVKVTSADAKRASELNSVCLALEKAKGADADARAKAAAMRAAVRPMIEHDMTRLPVALQHAVAAMLVDANPCKSGINVVAGLELDGGGAWNEPLAGTTQTLDDVVRGLNWPSATPVREAYAKQITAVGHGWLVGDTYDNVTEDQRLSIKVLVTQSGAVVLGDKTIPRLRLHVTGTVKYGTTTEPMDIADLLFEAEGQEVDYKSATDKFGLTLDNAVAVTIGIESKQLIDKMFAKFGSPR